MDQTVQALKSTGAKVQTQIVSFMPAGDLAVKSGYFFEETAGHPLRCADNLAFALILLLSRHFRIVQIPVAKNPETSAAGKTTACHHVNNIGGSILTVVVSFGACKCFHSNPSFHEQTISGINGQKNTNPDTNGHSKTVLTASIYRIGLLFSYCL